MPLSDADLARLIHQAHCTTQLIRLGRDEMAVAIRDLESRGWTITPPAASKDAA